MSTNKKPIELLRENCTFFQNWNNATLYVDRKGTVRVGNRKKPTPRDVKYFKRPDDRGVMLDMPNSSYHAERDHVSSTAMKMFDTNIKKYHRCYVARDAGDDEDKSDELNIGAVTHSLLLDSDEVFNNTFVTEPTHVDGIEINKHKPDHREYLAKFRQHAASVGKTVVSEKALNEGVLLGSAAAQDELAWSMLTDEHAMKEVSLFSWDEKSGQRIKARLDLLIVRDGRPIIVDIKTTVQQNPQHFVARDVRRFGYDLSGALYCKAFRKLTGIMPEFVWLALSKDKDGDYHSFLATIEPADWLEAELCCEETLSKIATAHLGDQFVSPYSNKITTVSMKRYRD